MMANGTVREISICDRINDDDGNSITYGTRQDGTVGPIDWDGYPDVITTET